LRPHGERKKQQDNWGLFHMREGLLWHMARIVSVGWAMIVVWSGGRCGSQW
jgi:hypothetical protein